MRHAPGGVTQKSVYQKWPDQIFPIVILFFPTMVTLVLGGGGRVQRSRGPLPPKVYGHLKSSLVPTPLFKRRPALSSTDEATNV